mgnify:FL=1
MKDFRKTLSTNGRGYWSRKATDVQCMSIDIRNVDDDQAFGELRVLFDPTTWDVRKDGLIYTDSGFIEQLRHHLIAMGLAGDNVCYSEQGMQGKDYVSLDVGAEFLKSWDAHNG